MKVKKKLLQAGEIPRRLGGIGTEPGVGRFSQGRVEKDGENQNESRQSESDRRFAHDQVRNDRNFIRLPRIFFSLAPETA